MWYGFLGGTVDTAGICRLIAEETRRHSIPLLDVALVGAEGTVWHRRFSQGREESAETAAVPVVYRAGSISKMLTAVAVMRAVESGGLDLDAPIHACCPELVFADPSGAPAAVTLRHLLSHTAGLQRESPVGSYFDSTGPAIEETVLSMVGTHLVLAPGTRAKYSNIGPTIAAYVLSRVTGIPWGRQIEEGILVPLGMRHSGFTVRHTPPGARASDAWMTAFDGSMFPAPRFDLGTPPSGNLCSTAEDLARFARCLLAGGTAGDYRMLRPETLRAMATVQPVRGDPAPSAGFGLGMAVGTLHGCRTVGHGGAVYGYSADLLLLIDEGVGAIVLNNLDCAGGVNAKIRTRLLETALGERGRSFEPVFGKGDPGPVEKLPGYAGSYRSADEWAEVTVGSGQLVLHSVGTSKRLRRVGTDRFVTDDRMSAGVSVEFLRDEVGRVSELRAGETSFVRAEPAAPAADPDLGGFCGDYGPPHAGLRILRRASRLVCRIEWMFEYDLEPLGDSRFAFRGHGMYEGEELRFGWDDHGRAAEVRLSGIRFPRREGAQE